MPSLAGKHELHFKRDEDAREARDVDDVSADDTVLRNPYGVGAGVVVALAALVLGAAAGLGYIHAPALNPGPESEPLTDRWQLDPETARAFAVQARGFASMAPTVTTGPATAAEAPAAVEAEVTPEPSVVPSPAPHVVPAPVPPGVESGTTDNPY